MKFTFVIVLVVASGKFWFGFVVMSTEATRLLPEETHELVLHGDESLPHDVKYVQGPNCKNGCRLLCVPRPFVIACCICN
ncbi:hypothetical protein N665_1967s0016 [Sinapis alba]|nr:hypothetical protein N665_1967s0016 [Sinapis alba]